MICAIHLESPDTPDGLTVGLLEHGVNFHLVTLESTNSIPHICLMINNSVAAECSHVVLIASGAQCLDLPAIARAQAAAHRSVISYALISPIFPTSTDQWPNAPVTVYLPANQDPARSVSLRGFDVAHYSSSRDLATAVANQVASAQ